MTPHLFRPRALHHQHRTLLGASRTRGALVLVLTLSGACGGAPTHTAVAPNEAPAEASVAVGSEAEQGYQYRHEGASTKPLAPRDDEAPPIWFATPLGWKQFQLVTLEAKEELHHAFEYRLQIRVLDRQLDPAALLGTLASIGVRSAGQFSYFSGYVSQVEQAEGSAAAGREGTASYRTLDLTLIPFTGLLTRRADCAVIEQHDVPRVLATWLAQRPFAAFRLQLLRRYPKQPYFVQYREADQNFLQRLIEHVGLISTFEHGPAGHTLALFDDASSFDASVRRVTLDARSAQDLHRSRALGPDRYVLRMSRTGASAAQLEGSYGVSEPSAQDLQIYDYEGSAESAADAAFYVRLRLEEQLASGQRLRGTARGVVLRPLDRVELTDHGELNGSYRVLAVTIQLRVVATEPVFAIEFEATPVDQPLRPQRRTAWPVIDGPQVVEVVEAALHDVSRVKVRLPWARSRPAVNELWVPLARAALDSSGAAPGAGSQVVLEYLEGEPSRPLVTGVVSTK